MSKSIGICAECWEYLYDREDILIHSVIHQCGTYGLLIEVQDEIDAKREVLRTLQG